MKHDDMFVFDISPQCVTRGHKFEFKICYSESQACIFRLHMATFSILSVTLCHKLELPIGYTYGHNFPFGRYIRSQTPHQIYTTCGHKFNSQYVTLGHNVHSPVTRRGHKVTFVLG